MWIDANSSFELLKGFLVKWVLAYIANHKSHPFFTAVFFSVRKLTKQKWVFCFIFIPFSSQNKSWPMTFGSHHMTAQSVISYNNKYTVKVIPSFEQSLRQNKSLNIYCPATNSFCMFFKYINKNVIIKALPDHYWIKWDNHIYVQHTIVFFF